MPGRSWPIALVASTVLKGIFDYAGTYLVNHAGFGMITDLRNDLYNSVLRRSAAFFQKHTTGTLISTIINDIERVQYAMSSVLAEFLQQFFTFVFIAIAVVILGRRSRMGSVAVRPGHHFFRRAKSAAASAHTTRTGQDKLADIQNILHETITGNRIVKAFSMESWEIARFRNGRAALVPRQSCARSQRPAISSPLMDIFGAVAIALLVAVGPRPDRSQPDDARAPLSRSSPLFSVCTTRCASSRSSITTSSRPWALRRKSSSSWILKTIVREKPGAKTLATVFAERSLRTRRFAYAGGWRRVPRSSA